MSPRRSKATPVAAGGEAAGFNDILALIASARRQAVQAVNTVLIELYWQVGAIISRKIAAAEWGTGVVERLAERIAREHPGLRGFTRANLFRMRQFYEAYRDDEKVAPLVRQIPWSHHFYSEELDRDLRKPHENPAIGVLLCASKDDEVVEYALSRSLSPALIAEYQTQLPDKQLLQAKLHEFYRMDAVDGKDEV